jgi:hypothetical protein
MIDVDRQKKGSATHPGRSQGRFASGMAGADDRNIVILI